MTFRDRAAPTVAALGLMGAIVAAYGPFLGTGFGGSDSLPLIETSRFSTAHEALSLFTKPVMAETSFVSTEVMYRPFVSLTFGIDYGLWGLNAVGYHLANLGLHVTTTLTIWWLLNLLGLRWWSSLAGAAVFALHPLVLATVPVIARRDSLVPVFAFTLALCLALLADRTTGRSRKVTRTASVVLAVVALLSKESAFAAVGLLPVVLVGSAVANGDRPLLALRGSWRQAVPYWGLAVTLFVFRLAVLGGLGGVRDGTNLLQINFEKYTQILGAYTRYLIWAFAWAAPSPAGVWPRIGAVIFLGLSLSLVWLPRRHAVVLGLGVIWVIAFGVFCAVLKISTIGFVAYFALLGPALIGTAGFEGGLVTLRSAAAAYPRRLGSIILLGGLAFAATMWLATSALFRSYDQWQVAGDITRRYVESLQGCVAASPIASYVSLTGLPDDLDDGQPETQLLAVTLLRDYTVMSWLKLAFPGRVFGVDVASTQTLRTTDPSLLTLTCTPTDANRLDLNATVTNDKTAQQ